MARKSPLDDPAQAAHAWARYRRILRTMFLVTLGLVALAMLALYRSGQGVTVHVYIAAALGLGLTMLLTSALMGLVFLSAGTGHDEAVGDDRDDPPPR